MNKIIKYLLLGLLFFASGVAAETYNNQYPTPVYNYARTVSVSANYTVLTTDDLIYVDATDSSLVLTLPEISDMTKGAKTYCINKTDTTVNIVTVVPNSSSETIGNSDTAAVITHYNDKIIISAHPNDTNWEIDFISPVVQIDQTTGHVNIGGNLTVNYELYATETASVTLDDGSGASPSLTFKDGTDSTAVFQKNDTTFLDLTTEPLGGLNIKTGSLKVGNGTPGTTLNGEDAYVEGTLEVDGAVTLDGTVAANGVVTFAADPIIGGTTPKATVGDAGEEDAQVTFDGAAQDFSIGLDDTADDFVICVGSALGTTNALAIDENTDVTTVGNLITEGCLDLGTVQTFTDSDATPDVSDGSYWNTNTTTFTITDFDGAGLVDGQVIVVISKGAITFDVTTSGIKGGSTDIVTAAGDVTTFIYDGTDWYVIGRYDLSDDLN